MCAWGRSTSSISNSNGGESSITSSSSSSFTNGSSSCDDILQRLEQYDPTLTSITILPMKSFGDIELNRISQVFENSCSSSSSNKKQQTIHLQSLHCSGHAVSPNALHRFGAAIMAISCQNQNKNSSSSNFASLAIGDVTMGDVGVQALIDGMLSCIPSSSPKSDDDINNSASTLICSSLTTLDLSYKGMTMIGLMSVVRLCHMCHSITHLNLSRNTFTYIKGSHLDILQEIDPIFNNIIDLDISSCDIDTKFTRRIFQYMDSDGDDHSCDKSFNNDSEILSSQQQHIATTSDVKEKKRMRRSLSPKKRLQKKDDGNSSQHNNRSTKLMTRTIRLDNNPIGDKGLKQLLKLNRLYGIHVSNCQLSDAAMLHITVASSSSLNECITLDISNNKAITTTGMTVLGDVLKRRFISVLLPKLTHLNISGNASIGTDGIQALLMGLVGRTLETCDFSETNCSGPGAILAIVGSVKEYCCTIQSLRLYNNNIGSNGFYKISEILSDILLTSELHTLDLAGNNAGQGSVTVLLKAVLNAIEQNTSKNRKSEKIALKCLIIGGNQGGFDVEAVIKQIHALRPDIDIARDKKGRL